MTITVRPAAATDVAAVDALLRTSFPAPDEADLVRRLCVDGDMVLMLVAVDEAAKVLAGVAAFSRMAVDVAGKSVTAVALAPVAVAPDVRRQGVAEALIHAGLSQLEDAGVLLCFVLGEPGYYTRFGFHADYARNFDSPYAGDYLMALPLQGGLMPAGSEAQPATPPPSRRSASLERRTPAKVAMTARRRATFAIGLLFAAAAGAVLLQPGAAACAVMEVMPLQRLPDGSLADPALASAERRAVVMDHIAARRRIARMFGPARATPLVVHLDNPTALWPFSYNSFGSTDFLPGRTCIVLGPDGRNVDVMAHELMHAELVNRIGFWRRRTAIPIWFDEGVGMQVDTRAAFDRPKTDRDIRRMVSARDFFHVSPDELTDHYALAKREVGRWLDRHGRHTLYARLAAIHEGERFDEVWAR